MDQSVAVIESLPAMPAPPDAQALRLALMESRQRWRQFGALATDLAFETDSSGHLTFIAPDTVLGWRAGELVGRPARWLLAAPEGPDPFCARTPAMRRHTWFRSRDGEQACMMLTVMPMTDTAGRHRGVRAVAVNVTAAELEDAGRAAALRRAEALDHILGRMRREVVAPRMMEAVLDGVMRALGCSGTAVVQVQSGAPDVLHSAGAPVPALEEVLSGLIAEGEELRSVVLACGTQLLACPCSTRFGERAALLGWRCAGGRAWDGDDFGLACAVSGVVRIVLEHVSIQRELSRQARTDPLTGLLNRRAFMEDAGRRLDRTEREGLPGTLMFVDLDRLKQLNDRSGHDAGDSALLLCASLLRRTFRPSDVIARLGGDEFAIWLDGADSLTAAERAEELRVQAPLDFAHFTGPDETAMGVSIGIATRVPGEDETLEGVIGRADQAMYEAKRAGRGMWRVSQPNPAR